MPIITTRSLLATLVLAASIVSTQAGNGAKKESCPSVAAKTDCRLLKGIVHLRDNDIRLVRKGGGVVFVDPIVAPTDPLAVKAGLLKPDLILITHPHGDHFQPAVLQAYIKANPHVVLVGPAEVVKLAQENGITGMRRVSANETHEFTGFQLRTVPAYFEDPRANHPQAAGWVGYVLTVNGTRYYITGDTQPLPDMANLEVDVLLPLLAGCGGNLDQAVKMAELTKAQVVVPVHTDGQVATIKKYLAALPTNVLSAYYVDGQLNPPL